MRLVLDTNVVVSGLLWSGAPSQLLVAAEVGEIELFTSRALLVELSGVLARSKFVRAVEAAGLTHNELVMSYVELTSLVVSALIPPTIVADLSDDQVLACAVAAQADIIVSGDKHLHGLGGSFEGIRIVSPVEAMRVLDEL